MTAPDGRRFAARPIDYAPPPSVWRRHAILRRIVLAVVLTAATLAILRWGPAAWDRAAQLAAQRRCLSAAAPADRVVYDDHPTRRTSLLGTDPQYVSLGAASPVVWFSSDWDRFYALLSPPGGKPSATLFMGERRTPGGARRLVVVHGRRSNAFVDPTLKGVYLDRTVVFPATALSPGRILPSALLNSPALRFRPFTPVRFFAGQADPADASHFTIDFDANGERGTVDGWLRDDGIVKLERRVPTATQVTPPPPPSAASPLPPD